MNPDTLLTHRDFIRSITRGLLFDDTAREEVVQATMVAALDHAPKDAGATKAWLARIAENFAKKELRARRRRTQWEKAAAQSEGVPSTAEIVEREDTRRAVINHVLALPNPFRDTIILRYFEDLTPNQIAERLKVPAGTASSRLNRGLDMLRARLDEDSDGDRSHWIASIAPLIGLNLSQAESVRVAAITSQAGTKVGLAMLTVVMLIAVTVLGFTQPWSQTSIEDDGQTKNLALTTDLGTPDSSEPGQALDTAETQEPEANTRTQVASTHTTASGMVRNLAGRPVAHIQVRYSFEPKDGGKKILSEAYTDASGRYETQELGTGKLWMTLLSEMGFGPSQEFTQEIDASVTHDFTVHGRLTFAGVIKTEVPDALEIVLNEHIDLGEVSYDRYAVRRLELDDSGRFHFNGLHPGQYLVKIRSRHHIDEDRMILITGTRLGETIQLRQGYSLQGVVELGYEGDPGRSSIQIRKRGSKPRSVTMQEMMDFNAQVNTRPDGSFGFRNLPAGEHVLTVSNWLKTDAVDKRITQTFPVEIKEQNQQIRLKLAPPTELSIRIFPPAGSESTRGVIEVFDDRDRSIWKRDYRARRTDKGVRMTNPSIIPRRLLSALQSQITVENIQLGAPYRIRVTTKGCAPVERVLTAAKTNAIDIELTRHAGQFISTDSGSAEFWQVMVRPAESTEPWSRLLWGDSRVHVTNLAIPGDRLGFLEPGSYDFRFEADCYQTQTKSSIRIQDLGPQLSLRFPFQSGIKGHCKLVNSDGLGKPETKYHVFRWVEGAWMKLAMKSSTTGDDGRFDLSGLGTGRIKVSLDQTGGQPAAEFDSPKSLFNLELRLFEDGSAQARVTSR